MSARFNILTSDAAAVAKLQQELDVPRFMAATMVARGIVTPRDAREFLAPSMERDWLSPYDIPGMKDVIDGLESVVRSGRRIVVFGDFDLDGISATTVLTRGLRALGATADPFIPHRGDEGYGLSPAAIERMRTELDPECVVTVDCGISCKDEVALLKASGIQVFITDHHEPGEMVPRDVPVADPKVDPECPSAILAGVGVALKVVQALGGRLGQPHLWRDFTDFASLGTIADLMPMRDENRALVAEGVARMNDAPRPCISSLLVAAGAADKPVQANTLGFTIIPRLNAAGRMGDAMLALNLLMSDDLDTSEELAGRLDAVNDQRRAIEAELAQIASAQAEQVYHGQRILVVAGEGWHEGVKGIVAGRIAQSYGVPTILFSIDPETGEAHGSGRVVGQVNLFKAVESVSDLLTRFGGHEAAVGITLPADKLPEFNRRLCEYMDTLPAESFHPRITIDSCIRLEEMSLANAYRLDALMPYGQENEQPCFLARNVALTNCRAVGVEKNHFSCQLTDGVNTVSAIMFHCHEIDLLMKCGCVVNAAFRIQVDEWRGRKSVKAMLKALSPVEPCAALTACLDSDCLEFVGGLYAAADADLIADTVDTPDEVNRYEEACERNRAEWEKRAQEDPAGLRAALIQAFIGSARLHDAQTETLDALGNGTSTLAVMATGRGKSLIFQVHAAMEALANHRTSVFVYPLRALIADQSFHLNQALEPFGIRSRVLTGDTTAEERQVIFAELADGMCDIVLTTPEFLHFHGAEFARTGRVGFAVVDEAHHMGLSRAGHRQAYRTLGREFDAFRHVTVLALTATADAAIADAISQGLDVPNRVLDSTGRPNLKVDDQRNLRRRREYLANLIAPGEKTVIYVNSRAESVALARDLRSRVPQLAPLIGFYNAGLSRAERTRVEEMFRTNALCVLVATSAFGEGVNIPNIRHAVIYQLPYNEVEFNQMCGRVGRDGLEATIHLLYSRDDRQVNERVLAAQTPDHDNMAQVYRLLRDHQKNSGDAMFEVTVNGLVDEMASAPGQVALDADSVKCALAVFRELGLIEVHMAYADGENVRRIHVPDSASKVALDDSVRYSEGLEEIEIFRRFSDWAFGASTGALRRMLTNPILPNDDYRLFSREGDEKL